MRSNTLLMAVVLGLTWSPVLVAQANSGTAVVRACSLMTKDEVKRHLPWPAILDNFPVTEEAVGTAGSACEYPKVRVQVVPFSQGTLETIKKMAGTETITGIGDEAYLHNNRGRFAELIVKIGTRSLMLQASFDGSIDTVKPGVLSLARALVPKLW